MKSVFIGDVQSGAHDGAEVELKGWVKRTRGNNNLRFVVLRDSTGSIQCVVKRDTVGDEVFASLSEALIESSMILKGTVKVDERADGGHELAVLSGNVVGGVDPERPPRREQVADRGLPRPDATCQHDSRARRPRLVGMASHHESSLPRRSATAASVLAHPRAARLGSPPPRRYGGRL